MKKKNNFGADEKYLFAKIYPKLDLSDKVMEQNIREISILASDQVKRFGGNRISNQDMNRGRKRALKLINLGLEKASKKTIIVEGEEIFNSDNALFFLKKRPLATFYNLGLNFFEANQRGILKQLAECEKKIGSFWFRMIGEEEMNFLKSASNLDSCHGTLAEYNQALEICLEILDKIFLIPCLPFYENNLFAVSRFGAVVKGSYPEKTGLIDIVLTSLLIACLFRESDNFLTKEMKEMFMASARINAAQVKGAKQRGEHYRPVLTVGVVDAITNLWEDRLMEGDVTAQTAFMLDFLSVETGELVSFSNLLIESPDEFRMLASEAVKCFERYFLIIGNIKRFKSPVEYAMRASKVLPRIADQLVRMVQNFYVEADLDTVSSAKIVSFWGDKIIFGNIKDYEDLHALAEKGEQEIDLDILIKSHPRHILNATRRFAFWSIDRKKEFISKFNPNRLVSKNDSFENLLYFLKSLSPEDSGWTDTSKISSFSDGTLGLFHKHDVPDSDGKSLILYEPEECWVEVVLQKIAWQHLTPYYIGGLWRQGSDKVRDFIYFKRDSLKASMIALVDYYISDQKDTRLVEYMVKKLFYNEKIKTSEAWEKLFWYSENNPGLLEKIKKLREELTQQ